MYIIRTTITKVIITRTIMATTSLKSNHKAESTCNSDYQNSSNKQWEKTHASSICKEVKWNVKIRIPMQLK